MTPFKKNQSQTKHPWCPFLFSRGHLANLDGWNLLWGGLWHHCSPDDGTFFSKRLATWSVTLVIMERAILCIEDGQWNTPDPGWRSPQSRVQNHIVEAGMAMMGRTWFCQSHPGSWRILETKQTIVARQMIGFLVRQIKWVEWLILPCQQQVAQFFRS